MEIHEQKKEPSNVFKDQIQKEKETAVKSTANVHFILRWVNNVLYPNHEVYDFTSDWEDGKLFCALANIQDEKCVYDSKKSNLENITNAFDTFSALGVEPILDPNDAGKEKKSMMLYLKLIKDAYSK